MPLSLVYWCRPGGARLLSPGVPVYFSKLDDVAAWPAWYCCLFDEDWPALGKTLAHLSMLFIYHYHFGITKLVRL